MAETIKSLSDEALAQRLAAEERELVRARFSHSLNQLQNTARLREIRKGIARMKTEARAREIKNGLSKDALMSRKKGSVAAAPGAQATAAAERGGFLKGIVDKLTAKE